MHENNVKICYISDLHFENLSFEEIDGLLYKLFQEQIIELYKCDLFVLAGDISDDICILSYSIKKIYDYVIVKKLALKMLYVLGNHDMWDKTLSFNSVEEKIYEIKKQCHLENFNILYREKIKYNFKNKEFNVGCLFGWYQLENESDFCARHSDAKNLITRYNIDLQKEYIGDYKFLNSLENIDLIVSHVPLMEKNSPLLKGFRSAFFTSIIEKKISKYYINGHTHVDVVRIDEFDSIHVSNNQTKTSISKDKAMKLALLVMNK